MTETEYRKSLIVVSTKTENLADNQEFITALHMEQDPHDENARYLEEDGDFWTCDPDHVMVDRCMLDFNWIKPFIVINFDPYDYPKHVELIKRWLVSYHDQDRWDKSNLDFVRTDQMGELGRSGLDLFIASTYGIWYRGGRGYLYGVYVPREIASKIVLEATND